jgi:CubicO group peptidase (beta-lactamase class C family)
MRSEIVRIGLVFPPRFAVSPKIYCCAIAAVAIFAWQSCQSPSREDMALAFVPDKLAAIDQAIGDALGEHRMRGAVFWLEQNGTVYRKAFGYRAMESEVEPMTEDTIFDAASLTKVIATTPAILLLMQENAIAVDAPACCLKT